MKEKERAIRILKSDRDSLFDEVKRIEKKKANNIDNTLSRTTSRKKIVDNPSPVSIAAGAP